MMKDSMQQWNRTKLMVYGVLVIGMFAPAYALDDAQPTEEETQEFTQSAFKEKVTTAAAHLVDFAYQAKDQILHGTEKRVETVHAETVVQTTAEIETVPASDIPTVESGVETSVVVAENMNVPSNDAVIPTIEVPQDNGQSPELVTVLTVPASNNTYMNNYAITAGIVGLVVVIGGVSYYIYASDHAVAVKIREALKKIRARVHHTWSVGLTAVGLH